VVVCQNCGAPEMVVFPLQEIGPGGQARSSMILEIVASQELLSVRQTGCSNINTQHPVFNTCVSLALGRCCICEAGVSASGWFHVSSCGEPVKDSLTDLWQFDPLNWSYEGIIMIIPNLLNL